MGSDLCTMARDKLSHQFEKIKKSNSPEGPRFGRKTSRMGATGYFTHPQCMKHEMGAGHPECPERLSAIEDRLLVTGLDMALQRREAGPAALADIELAHGRMHVAALRGLSDNLRDDVDIAIRVLPQPPETMVAKDMGTVSVSEIILAVDEPMRDVFLDYCQHLAVATCEFARDGSAEATESDDEHGLVVVVVPLQRAGTVAGQRAGDHGCRIVHPACPCGDADQLGDGRGAARPDLLELRRLYGQPGVTLR